MATGPKIVHKQFNSPIGLYSQQNIKETLTKHMQNLGNGTVGIDFNDPITDKPANLANSAVLRMLEEEERNRRGGRPSQKKVVWPPVPETNGYHQTPQTQGSQPGYPSQPQLSPSQYSPQPDYGSSRPSYSEPQYQAPQKNYEPPPATITLRQQQPVHQKPPPVFPSQPATASYQGGSNMRGDQKWPPQSVKEAVAAENEARRQLARGPACRPRKVKKDYGPFFAQHALNNNYPGYRAPPGTQHYEDHSGRSSY